jgi:oligosaccharyl transferase (archaeosortase A-associated)
VPKRLPAIAVVVSVLLAFGFRVLPGYRAVFTPRGISFQEPDAWFHMRTVHNLLAHFPRRSGFDPYGLYPGGESVSTGPFWDYMIGTPAWIAGAGSPSDYTVDQIGAWLPAILGALFPVLVFFLARRLYDTGTAVFGAVWVAIIPGTFMWVSHLGMADHHGAEAFLSFLALLTLCAAAEMPGKRRWILAALSGLALAAYLSTRAAGVFVPAIFAVAAILSPSLAAPAAAALGLACLLFLAAGSSSPWANFTALSLAAGLAITVPLAGLNRIAAGRHWSRRFLYGMVALIALAAIGCLELVEAAKIHDLTHVIRNYLPGRSGAATEGTIGELQPLWVAKPGGFLSLFDQFGAAWLLAILGLGGIFRMAWRNGRPALTLFAVWTFAMILGVFLQLRMAAYAGFVVAIAAGITTAWIVRLTRGRAISLRALAAGALLVIGMAVAVPIGIIQAHSGLGPDEDWWTALNWMRWNTPEPMGGPSGWYRWWPQLSRGAGFAYPNSAYGVIAPWDKGWWISGISRRIPTANGQQDGAAETSKFLMETHPDQALRMMRQMGAKYVVIGPGPITSELPIVLKTAGRDIDDYSRLFFVPVPGGRPAQARFYLPAFYRSMAARLYLFEGRRIETTKGVLVLLTAPSNNGETIQSVRQFASAKEAEQWMAQHPYETAHLASGDATASCVNLDELPWIRRVFVSSGERIRGDKQPTVVKVFELTVP